MNRQITLLTSKITEKFEFWAKLKIKYFEKFKLKIEECIWGGEAPSNILFKYQIEQLKYFDFAVSLKIRTFMSFCSSTTWFVCSLPNFLHFVEFQQIRKKTWISRIFDSNSCYFSSDLKFVNIGQIEMNQNTEMESNTSTLCFRWWNDQIPLFSRGTLEN